jgi:hypothetical protein
VPTGRRLATLLVVLALVALPALALRVFCTGKSCESSEATASVTVPFCPLPEPLRSAIAAGFREDRSPDALGVATAEGPGVETSVGGDVETPWPSIGALASTRVPIAFFGGGFTGSAPPDGTGLDQIAPTLAVAIGYRPPHPEVRSGTPAQGVAEAGGVRTQSSLVVEIVWKAVGSPELEARPLAWPYLRSLIGQSGTLEATTGSLPLDPAATLTTIGTGGLPSQHGITGTVLRGDGGTIARAWAPGAPTSVIATLADDLDESLDQAAHVGAVLGDASDRGLIGDGWYLDERDRDDVTISRRPTIDVARFLDDGYGSDGNPGVIGVVLEGSIPAMDRTTEQLVDLVRGRVPLASFAVAATGSAATPGGMSAAAVVTQVEDSLGASVVAAQGSGGLFIDRDISSQRSITADTVATAMGAARGYDGAVLFTDTFPSFAVSFARYC